MNVVGSFVLGLVAFAETTGDVALFLGVGACGSFTTYSSFSFQTVRLWEAGDRRGAVGYAVGTLALCVAGVGGAAGVVSVVW